ncbi:ribbon-helix-helix protein, CopG family [Oceanospirillum sanctuarii]|uniref:ribbon-helix-helix protein, CopG family n=1 Tax=Oceanospirillum sanctuarii TaxID=1434821 RepID=UPI000A3BEA7F|nr:ribbon-helix-helix protein, CopG family [Oceanospirillum sanctuarii]
MATQETELPADSNHKKKNTSLRLDSKTLKALKIRAIEEDTSVQKLIENLIQAYLDGRITFIKGK